MGVGVGDGLLVTGSTVGEGVPLPLGFVVCGGVWEPVVAEPPVVEGSVAAVGWSVLVGAELLVPVSVDFEFDTGAESVRFSGVTVVLLS